MNIKKNKLTFVLGIFCSLIFVGTTSAQITEHDGGATLKSNKNWSQLVLKNGSDVFCGGLRGTYQNGATEVSLFDDNYANTITARKGNVLVGKEFNIASGGWTWLAQNWKWEGTAERINDGKVAAMVFDNESNIRFYTADYGVAADPSNNVAAGPVNGSHKMVIKNNGKLAIGSSGLDLIIEDNTATSGIEGDYNLFVEKGILTEKVKVAVAGLGDWADYVFEEDYEMLEINELEDYVSENKHLPNVPSAEEMVENGLDVAKMDAKLLEKIEEAYLYIIDLNKKVEGLAEENESLKASLQGLSTSAK